MIITPAVRVRQGWQDTLRNVRRFAKAESGKPKAKRSRKPLQEYRFYAPNGQRGSVTCKSRCDARSLVKRALGIPMKRRLPINVDLIRVA